MVTKVRQVIIDEYALNNATNNNGNSIGQSLDVLIILELPD